MTAIHIQVSHAFRNNQKSNMKAFLLKKKKKKYSESILLTP